MSVPNDERNIRSFPKQTRRRPGRERLTATADRLFYEKGIEATSVERIIETAGVARGTFYGNFLTREHLVDAYLQQRHERTISELSLIEMANHSPSDLVEAIFEHLAGLRKEDSFRGCAFVMAAAEIPDPNRPPMKWLTKHKRAVLHSLGRMFERASIRDSEQFAQQVAILYDGALVVNMVGEDFDAVEQSRVMAHKLLRDLF